MAESSKSSSAARNELGAIKKRLEPVLYNGTPPGEHGSQSTKHGSHLVRWPSLAVKEALDLIAALPYEVVPAVPQSRPPSAQVLIPRLRPRLRTARTIAAESSSRSSSLTKERSILILSKGKLRRLPSEETCGFRLRA